MQFGQYMKICARCAAFESLGIGECTQGGTQHSVWKYVQDVPYVQHEQNNMCNMCRVWKFGYRWVQAGGHTMLSLDSSPLVIPLPAGRAPSPWSQREPSPPHALQSPHLAPHLPPPLPSPPSPASTSSNTPSQPYLFNQHLSSFDSRFFTQKLFRPMPTHLVLCQFNFFSWSGGAWNIER